MICCLLCPSFVMQHNSLVLQGEKLNWKTEIQWEIERNSFTKDRYVFHVAMLGISLLCFMLFTQENTRSTTRSPQTILDSWFGLDIKLDSLSLLKLLIPLHQNLTCSDFFPIKPEQHKTTSFVYLKWQEDSNACFTKFIYGMAYFYCSGCCAVIIRL